MFTKSYNTGKQTIQTWLGPHKYEVLRTYQHFWQANLQGKQLVFVHTMGKVASSSITYSLKSSPIGKRLMIYHTHFLSPQGLAYAHKLADKGFTGPRLTPTDPRNFLVRSQVLSQQLAHLRRLGRRVKVITLVRDAVSTNLSGYFYNSYSWPAALREQARSGDRGVMEALAADFLAHYPHDVPLNWFDMEVKNVFGIDVYAEPFPQEQGYQIYRSDSADLLLLKLDQLTDCADAAFKAFMGLPQFTLTRVNEANDQWYAPLYKEFTNWVRLPGSYLAQMYETRYTQQFFNAAEQIRLRQRWSKDLAQPALV
ncbi:MAG TPA: putative capsular polysaccharide synthesis family protein [Caldilineaceae bacterium]|nr:putative capsular polysaccharide synthesis family protein [Caldilineaceae bacterium]